MSDRADGLCVPEPDDQAPIHELEDTPFGLHGGVGVWIRRQARILARLAMRRDGRVVDDTGLENGLGSVMT
jgi:hypothetical protein